MLGTLFGAVVGSAVWVLANVLYYGMKRRGERGFGRFAAFWVGMPTTWVTLFAVREQRQPRYEVDDDDAALLAEVRRDRALRETRREITPAPGPDREPALGADPGTEPMTGEGVGPSETMPPERRSR